MSFEAQVAVELTLAERERERTATMETAVPGGGGGPTNASYVVLGLNATLTDERVLTGTANQVVITDNGAGSTVVLSLPQSIAITSSPTFANLTITTKLTISSMSPGDMLYVPSAGGGVSGSGNGVFFTLGSGLLVNSALSADVDFTVRTQSLLFALFVDASTDAVGINQGAIAASAILDIASTTKGLLPPRMTTVERDAIGSPAAGLVLYDSTTGLLNYRNASAWVTLTTPTVTGSGSATRVAYWSSASALTSDSAFTFESVTNRLTVDAITVVVGLNLTGATANAVLFADPGATGLVSWDSGFLFDGVTLFVTDSNALTTPLFIITQSSTGDAAQRFAIGTTASFAVGIDNSDSDKYKISYAASGTAVLGTGDIVTIDGATRVVFIDGSVAGATAALYVNKDVTDSASTTLTARLDLYHRITTTAAHHATAIQGQLLPVISTGITESGALRGLLFAAYRINASDLGTISGNLSGLVVEVGHVSGVGAGAVTTTTFGMLANQYATGNGTMSNLYGVAIINAGAGVTTVTNSYGVYVDQVPGATLNYAIYTTQGTLRFGGTSASTIGFRGVAPAAATTLTQTYSTTSNTHAAVTSLAAPAGGTGATAGAYDTAANRNLMITSQNAIRTDLANLKDFVNGIADALQAMGLVF